MNKKSPIFFAVLAAVLYAFNSPFSKLLLNHVSSTMMAAFLYLGAGAGVFILWLYQKNKAFNIAESHLAKKDIPYTLGMIILDIAAPVFLMLGLSKTTAANAALLNNFEIAATSLIAMVLFKEAVSKKLWLSIILVTISSIILSFENIESFSFSIGSIFVLSACICWGFENNCTRMLSGKNPMEIVIIKGIFSGFGSFLIACMAGEPIPKMIYIFFTMLLGFVSYGLSIFFYVYAQRSLGAAKTSTYYAVAPFIGVVFSLIIFRQLPNISFFIAFIIMAIGTYLASK